MKIKIRITPSTLEEIASILKKEAEYCKSIGNTKTEIVSALNTEDGEKIILAWKPLFEEDGKIRNL